MEKWLKAILILLTILTAVYVSVVIYANATSARSADSTGDGKDPVEYGIWRHYLDDKLEAEPAEWYTPEQLGIALVRSQVTEERYHIFIADEEKALPWMNGTKPMPYAVKYENAFYHIAYLWVTPGLPENAKQWQIPAATGLGAGWASVVALFFWRKKE